jgi:hypothetical protein
MAQVLFSQQFPLGVFAIVIPGCRVLFLSSASRELFEVLRAYPIDFILPLPDAEHRPFRYHIQEP